MLSSLIHTHLQNGVLLVSTSITRRLCGVEGDNGPALEGLQTYLSGRQQESILRATDVERGLKPVDIVHVGLNSSQLQVAAKS